MSEDAVAVVKLPEIKAVKDTFVDLLGREVDVLAIDHWMPDPGQDGAIAEFLNDRKELAVVCMMDLALSVYTGAAIGMLPPGGAQDMVADREFTALIGENLYEVLNILTSVFNTADGAHVKIGAMIKPGDVIPPDVAAVIPQVVRRLDLSLDIQGYGGGRLALLLA